MLPGALLEREATSSTAIGHAVAVPHAYLDALTEPTVVFVRLQGPLNLGAPDGIPTRFLFFLLGPPTATAQHLDTLANAARLMSDEEFRYDAGLAHNSQDLVAALERCRARAIGETVAPPDTGTPPGLRRTGRLFGGIREDLARRMPKYVSRPLRKGCTPSAWGSTLFLFFACLAPAVTFGGVMSTSTAGQIGAVEMILASAICGVIYALASGQPLIILGGTGPLPDHHCDSL